MNLADTPYCVSPMLEEDVPAVSAIEGVVFSMPWSETAFRYQVRDNHASDFFVLRYCPWETGEGRRVWFPVRRLLGGRIEHRSLLGYAGFWTIVDEAHICTIALRPDLAYMLHYGQRDGQSLRAAVDPAGYPAGKP